MTDKWDNREKRMRLGNPFNIKLIVFLGIVVLAVSLAMAFAFPPIYADYTFNVFDDGLTYSEGCDGESRMWYKECAILYEDKWYRCNPNHGGSNSWINPVCVEIIMRSIP